MLVEPMRISQTTKRGIFFVSARISFEVWPAGSRAAASHTGSLARENDVIFDSMIKQASAIRAQNLDDF